MILILLLTLTISCSLHSVRINYEYDNSLHHSSDHYSTKPIEFIDLKGLNATFEISYQSNTNKIVVNIDENIKKYLTIRHHDTLLAINVNLDGNIWHTIQSEQSNAYVVYVSLPLENRYSLVISNNCKLIFKKPIANIVSVYGKNNTSIEFESINSLKLHLYLMEESNTIIHEGCIDNLSCTLTGTASQIINCRIKNLTLVNNGKGTITFYQPIINMSPQLTDAKNVFLTNPNCNQAILNTSEISLQRRTFMTIANKYMGYKNIGIFKSKL